MLTDEQGPSKVGTETWKWLARVVHDQYKEEDEETMSTKVFVQVSALTSKSTTVAIRASQPGGTGG